MAPRDAHARINPGSKPSDPTTTTIMADRSYSFPQATALIHCYPMSHTSPQAYTPPPLGSTVLTNPVPPALPHPTNTNL